MNALKNFIHMFIPRNTYRALLAPYHFLWAFGSALYYGFPAKKLVVIGVTGTKGKSSVSELLHAVLSEAGHKTALAGTIRFACGDDSRPNLYKMTLPGHNFVQKFLHEAVEKGCTHAVIELTSEGALQYRHAFLSLNALVFTNLQLEHIESHGSFEKYLAAKLRIGTSLVRSKKRPRAIIANNDDAHGKDFLALRVEERIPFSYADALAPEIHDDSVAFTYTETRYTLPQPGKFSVLNALAVLKTALFLNIDPEVISQGFKKALRIPGRAERIEEGQDFVVIVDYAHTPDSLRALYDAFQGRRKICVLGNTGGGRDTWKRPLMGSIADEFCDEVILTDEDPYDEDPARIVEAMATDMQRTPRIILNRREAIAAALAVAKTGDAVLITGKGTDPYIMRAHGAKEVWSDTNTAREELRKMRRTN